MLLPPDDLDELKRVLDDAATEVDGIDWADLDLELDRVIGTIEPNGEVANRATSKG